MNDARRTLAPPRQAQRSLRVGHLPAACQRRLKSGSGMWFAALQGIEIGPDETLKAIHNEMKRINGG